MDESIIKGVEVSQTTKTSTVIEVSFYPDTLKQADEYIIVVNGVQVARWPSYSRNARRAGIE